MIHRRRPFRRRRERDPGYMVDPDPSTVPAALLEAAAIEASTPGVRRRGAPHLAAALPFLRRSGKRGRLGFGVTIAGAGDGGPPEPLAPMDPREVSGFLRSPGIRAIAGRLATAKKKIPHLRHIYPVRESKRTRARFLPGSLAPSE